MIKTTKGILLPVITLMFILIALTTTTFAWLTLGKVAVVSNISGDIIVGDGIEIALGIEGSRLTNYKSHLTASDWQLVMNELSDYRTNAVTTINGNDFYKLVFNNIDGKYGLYKSEAIKNVDYLDIEIYFKSNTSGTIYLTDFEIISEPVLFDPRVNYDIDGSGIKEVNSFNAYAMNAARLMIGNNIYQVDDIIPSNTHITNKGVNYGQFSYLTNMKNDIYWSNTSNNLEQLIKLTETNITDVEIANALVNITNGEVEVALLNNSNSNDYTAKVSVKLWIEGFDADAYDAIFGANLGVTLNFRKENIEQ